MSFKRYFCTSESQQIFLQECNKKCNHKLQKKNEEKRKILNNNINDNRVGITKATRRPQLRMSNQTRSREGVKKGGRKKKLRERFDGLNSN